MPYHSLKHTHLKKSAQSPWNPGHTSPASEYLLLKRQIDDLRQQLAVSPSPIVTAAQLIRALPPTLRNRRSLAHLEEIGIVRPGRNPLTRSKLYDLRACLAAVHAAIASTSHTCKRECVDANSGPQLRIHTVNL